MYYVLLRFLLFLYPLYLLTHWTAVKLSLRQFPWGCLTSCLTHAPKNPWSAARSAQRTVSHTWKEKTDPGSGGREQWALKSTGLRALQSMFSEGHVTGVISMPDMAGPCPRLLTASSLVFPLSLSSSHNHSFSRRRVRSWRSGKCKFGRVNGVPVAAAPWVSNVTASPLTGLLLCHIFLWCLNVDRDFV